MFTVWNGSNIVGTSQTIYDGCRMFMESINHVGPTEKEVSDFVLAINDWMTTRGYFGWGKWSITKN
jgi:hypothetical protein